MKNPATVDLSGLNEFTKHIKENEGVIVKLRNGTIVQPIFMEAEDEYCSDSFYTENLTHCWDVNGVSVTNSDLDMMELL